MGLNLKLGERLLNCAKFVPLDAKFVDIGTDHGYLPIWLLQNEKIKYAIAADINIAPLESARTNAEKYAVNIKTVLSNGFESLDKDDFDCAVIAGMGGELIANIIDSCDYIKDDSKTLILQPMTKSTKLREYLYKNNFAIEKEVAVKDKGKIYSVMSVRFGAKHEMCEYMGAIKPQSEYADLYATSVIRSLENQLHGSNNSEKLKLKIAEIKNLYKV